MVKALVPFVFVFAPSLLIMVSGFSWAEFVVAFIGCVLGITFLSAALSNYFLTRMRMWERLVCGFAAILMIAPGIVSTAIGIALVMPMISRQVAAARHRHAAA